MPDPKLTDSQWELLLRGHDASGGGFWLSLTDAGVDDARALVAAGLLREGESSTWYCFLTPAGRVLAERRKAGEV